MQDRQPILFDSHTVVVHKSIHRSSRLSEKLVINRKYVAYAASVSLLKDLSHLLVDARFLHQAYHHIQLWYRNLIILFSSGDIYVTNVRIKSDKTEKCAKLLADRRFRKIA